jgi:hypothetical protein
MQRATVARCSGLSSRSRAFQPISFQPGLVVRVCQSA